MSDEKKVEVPADKPADSGKATPDAKVEVPAVPKTNHEKSLKGVLLHEEGGAELKELVATREELAKLSKDAPATKRDELVKKGDALRESVAKNKEAGWKELGIIEKTKSAFGGNFGVNSGTAAKWARGGAAAMGVIYTGKKIVNIAKPELDEKGERKESLVVSSIKALTGAAVSVAALVMGGKSKAMGTHSL